MDIGALADGFLDEAEAAPIREHIQSCPDCASLYRDLCRVHDALSGDFDDPPDTLVPGVMYKIKLHSKGQKRLSFGWFTAAAAVLAIVLLANPLQEWLGMGGNADSAPPAPMAARMELMDEGVDWNRADQDAQAEQQPAPRAFDVPPPQGAPGVARMAGAGSIPLSETLTIESRYMPEWLFELADNIDFDLDGHRGFYYFLSAKMEQIIDNLYLDEVPFLRADDGLSQNAEYGLVIIVP